MPLFIHRIPEARINNSELGFKTYKVKNGDKVFHTHVLPVSSKESVFYDGPIKELPEEVLKNLSGSKNIFKGMRVRSLGKYIGTMPDGACALNAYQVHLKYSDDQPFQGYFVYRPYGETKWFALPHFWVERNNKVIEYTRTAGMPADILFIGKPCTPEEAYEYGLRHKHYILCHEKYIPERGNITEAAMHAME
jgi:hypothetical protein